jgi:hypothetical protein
LILPVETLEFQVVFITSVVPTGHAGAANIFQVFKIKIPTIEIREMAFFIFVFI